MSLLQHNFQPYQLNDRYAAQSGRVFLSGTQALVRIIVDQARRDQRAGLNTAGFVSGYRGSPLGAVDQELWQNKTLLDQHQIDFMPAVNEDLGATAVFGSQQVETSPDTRFDGVFAMWYGKGPGVDRSGDALKHGNAFGSSPRGGVLVVAGDDHGCVSSSMSHQSDVAFLNWFMPVLAPSNVAEFLEFGEYGYALSRFSGMWVGFKAVSETVEAAQSVTLRPDRKFILPAHDFPPGGVHYRWPDLPSPEIEKRMAAKKRAVFAFSQANPIDRTIYGVAKARFGIVSSGKAHMDTMEALRLLGVDEAACRRLGIDIYKVGMVWPLPRRNALKFVRGKEEVLVCEEKRGIIESQLKEYFYDWPGDKPARMVGKNDENLDPLIPWIGELSPLLLAPIIAKRLDKIFPGEGFAKRAEALTRRVPVLLDVSGATRRPYFCSGCPHNSSTKVPKGSKALAGIGCHFMACWMGRETTSQIQMGGEGIGWAASSRFTGKGHIFQNLGEGTWYHSGSMAIRQAIAAKANITYKILYNDAVAMTGGQPVDGPVSVQAIAHICRAEGVARIALVSDDHRKFQARDFPQGTSFHDRHDLDNVQRELREISGVTVLIYEQTCASKKRRQRKRGEIDDPARFAVINPLVCEGCGDCSKQSNCLSVEPLETEFGRKRQINLSSCNKDFTCLDGYCPAIVTVEGATRRKPETAKIDLAPLLAKVKTPVIPTLDGPFDLLVTGVGGTGVVTIGALITMAAHLEGKGSSVLDFTGFAQKFGAVLCNVRLAPSPDGINQVRIDDCRADAVIGCDIVVSSSPKASATYNNNTKIALNLAQMPTGDLVLDPDADLRVGDRQDALSGRVGTQNLWGIDANMWAEDLLGNAVYANVMMLGFAWQKGLVPINQDSLFRAIDLNGVTPDENKTAFELGRVLATDPKALEQQSNQAAAQGTDDIKETIATRVQFLTKYQNAKLGAQYALQIEQFSHAIPDEEIQIAAAKSLFKLMAYKDEYEVARLLSGSEFRADIAAKFQGDYSLHYHMAPPVFSGGHDSQGRPRKREFGRLMGASMSMLARFKWLRGTMFDPFGYSAERKQERQLIDWYSGLMAECANTYSKAKAEHWLNILQAPMQIRGYGPIKENAAKTVMADVSKRLGAIR